MISLQITRPLLLILCLLAFAAAACVQAQPGKPQPEFKPEVGQEGKDVIWVPTPQALVETMLDIAKTTSKDYVIDLGSGDGRTVIAAAKRGATALGVEYNPDMVELSRRNAATAGVGNRASFVRGDLFQTDLSKATVITMFLLPDINIKLRPKILNLRPGTRIVSNTFTMGEWEADARAEVKDGCASYCTALLWVVPAKVEGTWRLPQGELDLKQTFQMVSGTLKSDKGTTPVKGRLNGEEITFSAGATEYRGRVSGNAIEGSAKPGGSFKASRAGK